MNFAKLVAILSLTVLAACQTTIRPEPLPEPTPTPEAPVARPTPVPAPTPTAPKSETLTHPETDPSFAVLPNGKRLDSIQVSGTRLSLTRGSGQTFGDSAKASYTKAKVNAEVQYSLRNLDTGEIVAESDRPGRRIFGASSSKIFVGGALLDYQKGKLTDTQIQQMSDMIVVSSNTAWTSLQGQLGDGDQNRGRERNYNFTQALGLPKTQAFQGTWNKNGMHGNELTASETTKYLQTMYQKGFPGSEYLWKIMHTCRTGSSRGLKYLPSNLYVGGKTGTYDGPTYDTDIKKDVTVRIRNHVLLVRINGVQYGIAILNNTGTEELTAAVAGGLVREFLGVK